MYEKIRLYENDRIRLCHLTTRISDPALLAPGMESRRDRGVHCIRLVRRHNSSNPLYCNLRKLSSQR
jgi:hypothetical protein